MQQATRVGDEKQSIVKHRTSERAMKNLFKLDFAIAVMIGSGEVPDRSGVWIRADEISFVGLARAERLVRNRLLAIFEGLVEDQFAAELRR